MNDERTRSEIQDVNESPVPRRVLAFWPGGWVERALSEDDRILIGRSAECDIRIDLPSVSRKHVMVHAAPGGLGVEDLSSSNGTRIAGRRLPTGGRALLTPGATLEIGQATLVVVGDEAVSPPAVMPGGQSSAKLMDRVAHLVTLVATSNLSVLLVGETGVGKERTAERLHAASRRSEGPFIRINCAALPDTLLEAELFGHERGAFTGAHQTKLGLMEAAHEGTLFLDEVGELSIATQAKVLRAIESREVLRLGATKPKRVDVRFVAATNRDLVQLVATGEFRRDLYYRLDGIMISLPPLRERLDEIDALVAHFLTGAGAPETTLTPAARARLLSHNWPGNIRELRNVIERAVVLASGRPIDVAELGLTTSTGGGGGEGEGPDEGSTLRSELSEIERRRILAALEASVGNQTAAARMLGMARRTFLNRLDAYQIPRPRKGRD